MNRRAIAAIPNDSQDDADDEPLITPAERRGHEHWPQTVRVQASALLLQGQSVHATARQLGVPRATLQAWKLSDDPEARALHRERLLRMINLAYDVGEEMIEKVRTAPVPTAQHAAVSAGILLEKAQLLERSREVAGAGGDKPGTVMDLVVIMRKDAEERDRQSRNTLKATVLPITDGITTK